MLNFLSKWSQRIWLALAWSLTTQTLLSLPGSVLPSHGIFSLPYIDKVAHLGLFSVLVFFWCLYYYYHRKPNMITRKHMWIVVLICFLYGVLMEFVQENFIPNRSFDEADIVADLVGTLIGYLVTHWYLKLKIYSKN